MTDDPRQHAVNASDQATKLWNAGRHDEAIDTLKLALHRAPHYLRGMVELAGMLGQRYEIGEAEELLARAQTAAGQDAAALAAIASAYRRVLRPEKALAIYEQLHAENKLPLPLVGQLAMLYEKANRPHDALDAIRQCVREAPTQPQPQVLLARFERQSGDFPAAEKRLEELVAAGAASTVMIHAWSELAIVRDQQQNFTGAVEAIENAKTLLRQTPLAEQKSRQSLANNEAFARIYSQLDRAIIEAWSDVATHDHDCHGIAHLLGFPRSGTTLLEQVLDCHPRLRSASERVVFTSEIFPRLCQRGDRQEISLAAIQGATTETVQRLGARYLRCHEEIAGASLKGLVHLDKNPNHTSLMAGLYRIFPESRFIVALRDPRDVIVSTYMRFFALSEFSASYLTWGSTCALYAHEMNVWLKMRELMRDNWIEIKYEDTVTNVKATTTQVLSLLELPWDDGLLDYRRKSTQKMVNSPTHAEVRKPIHGSSVGRWRNYERQLAPYLPTLDPYIKGFGYE